MSDPPTPDEREWTIRNGMGWAPPAVIHGPIMGAHEEVAVVPRERAVRAERESGQWEARFMDEQAARRVAEVERDENMGLADSAQHDLVLEGRARRESERVRREVAEEIRELAKYAETVQEAEELEGLAARLEESERA